MAEGIQIRVAIDNFSDSLTFVVLRRESGKREIATLEFHHYDLMENLAPKALPISREEAQYLMNMLWECGLRPAQAAGSAGQLDATRAHLEDMRTLVFKDQK